MTQIELQNESARTVHKDMGGAYFHGKQPDIGKPSGRAIFAPIHPGWAGLGANHGLCFDEHQRGEPMLLQVAGNVPGLQNAGVTWAEESIAFLLGFGFKQSIVDRRLFYLHDKSGPMLMAGTFVDDCKLVVQSETMAGRPSMEEEVPRPSRRGSDCPRLPRA